MVRNLSCAIALSMACMSVQAQDAELRQLREELKRLQDRITELERRQQAAPPTPAVQRPASNLDIGLILQGTVARSSRDPNAYQITGFAPSGGEVAPAPRSFGIGESELVIGGNIDPYFRGLLIAALTPNGQAEVEEAYVQTLALGRGITLKGGRFLSGIGYQNEVHRHAWDFQDAPLAYKAFLGGRLNDDGVQLRWVAPTELFLELGAELGRGRAFPSAESSRNRAGIAVAFAHIGGDIRNAAWRAGLSLVNASAQDRGFTDNDSLGNAVAQGITGRSRLWIADAVAKWGSTFKLQGEYFWRRETGTLAYDDTQQNAPRFNATFVDAYASRQRGWYAQGVWQFMPRWRLGYRYDKLYYGTVGNAIVTSAVGPTAADFPLLLTSHNPSRSTLMVDWSPTEFSRLRLQLAADKSASGVNDRQVVLQYIHSLGAHGAHRF
jgi:hypothetical protein